MSQSQESSLRGTGRPSSKSRRSLLIGGLAGVSVAALAGRLWQLQITQASEFISQAETNRTRSVAIPPIRGLIFDRAGRQLVRNTPVFSIWATPADIPEDDTRHVSDLLAELTEEDRDEVELAISLGRSDPGEPVRVAREVSRETALIVAEKYLELPGVEIRDSTKREYSSGETLGAIVGYTGPIPAERAAEFARRGARFDEDIGLAGIEKSLQEQLRGEDGRRLIEVEALGREVRELAATPPRSGGNVFLTIDAELQQGTTELMSRYLGGRGAGVAIILDPNSGDVLSMVSYPSFDNSLFAEGISVDDFQRLANDSRRPLVNHAISGLYPPGSTYKIVAAAGALEENVAAPSTSIECAGHLILPSGWVFYDWLLTGHGSVNLHRAISESCNIYFYNISGGNPYTEFKGLGESRLAEFGRSFGFGTPTGIDLPNEAAGVVPDHKWKNDNLSAPWVTGDTYQAAIGQGLMQASPLQLVNMYAAIGNGGTLYKPRIVDRVEDADGEVVDVPAVDEIGKISVSPTNLSLIQRGLVETVNGPQGTGGRARTPVVTMAGKTGTAEYAGPKDRHGNDPSHAWFVGYAPADSPRIAFVVLIRDGGEGSLAAAPVARDLVELYFTDTIPQMRYPPFDAGGPSG
ncbi:MAG: penicillin-binding protein 2 [Chloroflexi bacterium]|nr:penicillin-binding protein 2 [Chloroflexota bacterium]MCY3938463.1 penicillin-binding protein 2 [Chloroflexota bacterium]